MTTFDATPYSVLKTSCRTICDLPQDILILIFSLLHGQDLARCIIVCRLFSGIIHRNSSLQYSVELAMNGMVDGQLSVLPLSEKLQRLRQYSSDFQSGALCHQDLTDHLDYMLQNRELGWPRLLIYPAKPSGVMFTRPDQDHSTLYLSHFISGSAHGGVPSSRSLFAVRDVLTPDLAVAGWAVDDAQDLLVIVEFTRTNPLPTNVTSDVYIRCYALSRLTMDSVTPTLHPATTLPVIQLHRFDSMSTTVRRPQIFGPYVILEIRVEVPGDTGRPHSWSYVIDVYNWKTGELVSRTDIGRLLVTIVPLDERYMLVFPTSRMSDRHPDLRIYNFAPCHSPRSPSQSSQSSGAQIPSESPEAVPAAARHVCTLELAPAPPGERVAWSHAKSGDRPSEESAGYFRADAARSIVSLYIHYEGLKDTSGYNMAVNDGDYEEEVVYEYAAHILIPRATLTAQIQAAESASTTRKTGSDPGADVDDSPDGHQPKLLPLPRVVPWADWGARGALQLYQRGALFDGHEHMFGTGHHVVPNPFGSRLPFVVSASDPDSFSDSDSQNGWARAQGNSGTLMGSVYVFDVNPLVARSARRVLREEGAMTTVVDPEDMEEVLPGVVDPECAAIPYVVYRFPLPYPSIPTTEENDMAPPGSPIPPPKIRGVTMSMAGFTVEFDDRVGHERKFQTFTV